MKSRSYWGPVVDLTAQASTPYRPNPNRWKGQVRLHLVIVNTRTIKEHPWLLVSPDAQHVFLHQHLLRSPRLHCPLSQLRHSDLLLPCHLFLSQRLDLLSIYHLSLRLQQNRRSTSRTEHIRRSRDGGPHPSDCSPQCPILPLLLLVPHPRQIGPRLASHHACARNRASLPYLPSICATPTKISR